MCPERKYAPNKYPPTTHLLGFTKKIKLGLNVTIVLLNFVQM